MENWRNDLTEAMDRAQKLANYSGNSYGIFELQGGFSAKRISGNAFAALEIIHPQKS